METTIGNDARASRNGMRFSLRTLLFVMAAAAVLAWLWRSFGATAIVPLGFAAASAIPLRFLSSVWRRSYGFAWLAAYAPFLATAGYTLGFVACDHCKAAYCTMLPVGPGLIAVEVARNWLKLNVSSGLVWFALVSGVAAVLVLGLAWVIRGCRWWWNAAATVVVVAFDVVAALGLLAIIRA